MTIRHRFRTFLATVLVAFFAVMSSAQANAADPVSPFGTYTQEQTQDKGALATAGETILTSSPEMLQGALKHQTLWTVTKSKSNELFRIALSDKLVVKGGEVSALGKLGGWGLRNLGNIFTAMKETGEVAKAGIDAYYGVGDWRDVAVQAAGGAANLLTTIAASAPITAGCIAASTAFTAGTATLPSLVICPIVGGVIGSKLGDVAEKVTEATVGWGIGQVENLIARVRNGGVNAALEVNFAGSARDVRIRVSVGEVTVRALGMNASAVARVAVANADGVRINVRTGDVTALATGLNARAEVVVGSGEARGVHIDAETGEVTSVAKGVNAKAITRIAIGSGNNARVAVSVDDVTTSSKGVNTGAFATIGEAKGARSRVDVQADDVSTIATGVGSTAEVILGQAGGNGDDVSVNVDDVTTLATSGGRAETKVGVTKGADANISAGDLTTIANGGLAKTTIGNARGRDTTVSVGDVTTVTGGGAATTDIGSKSSVYISGDVTNKGGDLKIGAGCAARRNGKCCVAVHRNWCVLSIVPPDSKGRCPPRYRNHFGHCDLYSDRKHSISR